jgi:hypothetical protein
MLGLRNECIRVNRFSLPQYSVGIQDVSEDLEKYVLDPNSHDISQQHDLEATLQAWKEESLYVFWWGEDLYVDNEGLVSSS